MRLAATVAILALGGCTWSYRYELDDSPEAREYAKRCLGIDWSEAEAGKPAEFRGDASRQEVAALIELVEKINAGGTPTDAEYEAAGCRQDLDSTE